jgi:hypothetical protein
VVGLHFGLKARSVSISDEGGGQVENEAHGHYSDDVESTFKAVVTAMAGRAAELKLTSKVSDKFVDDD